METSASTYDCAHRQRHFHFNRSDPSHNPERKREREEKKKIVRGRGGADRGELD